MALALLAIAILMFAASHVLLGTGQHKQFAKAKLGRFFGPFFGILSFALMAFALWAFRQHEPNLLYEPPSWGRHANYLLSLIGFNFFGIFLFRGTWRNKLRYPMAIGIAFWATGHLLANGDDRTTVLFAGLLVAAGLHAVMQSREAFHPSIERQGHNGLSILAGFALFGLATQLHTVLAGVPLIILQK